MVMSGTLRQSGERWRWTFESDMITDTADRDEKRERAVEVETQKGNYPGKN